MTQFPVTALKSVELGTPDLNRSEEFYTAVWGLEVVARQGGKVFLAASGDDHHVLELIGSDRSELRKIIFSVGSADDLGRLSASAVALGCQLLRPVEQSPGPAGGQRFVIREPQGSTLEFVHGDMTRTGAAVANRPLRLAHVNINSADVDGLSRFYEQLLGFQLTDRSKMMAFLRCNDDHHAVVLAEANVNGLNHIAFLMPDTESVMRASGRMVDNGYPIGWGVGRHGPGDNVFAYFLDPLGVVIEYTSEVLQVDDTYRPKGPDQWTWPPGRTDHWGIAPPKSEAVKAAQLAVPFKA
ncbi:VOC family protein [Rhizobium sp. L245/93]|uniref:VOC family protein n=1 Tax=Rhizobium sp. L245/93 TaxID=2819998 RepID=UPI001ADB0E7D|nr:VOC family protein [Rhizobium sp. L245/93]MBO9171774.1 VOC family protein [Rhizobium sp. L245/93]